MAHPLLQTIRKLYAFRCGYCGVSEVEVGGELTADHFLPISAGGEDNVENLVYACIRCNQYKGAVIPVATNLGHEHPLLHPLRDDLALHVHEDEATGRLEGLTATGNFYIEVLRLNRQALIVNRQRRNLIALLEARLEQALTENTALLERLTRRELYIAYLEQRLPKPTIPQDTGESQL